MPEGGARARREQGLETAVAQVPAEGHSRVGAPCCAPEVVGASWQQGGRVHGGARGREQRLKLLRVNGQLGGHGVSGGSAVGDAQALATEEAMLEHSDTKLMTRQPLLLGLPSATVTRADGSSRGME